MIITYILIALVLIAFLYILVANNYIQFVEPFSEAAAAQPNRWAVVQYDDRALSDHDKKLLEINKAFCKRHNYDHIFITKKYDHLPPYWVKVELVKEKLAEYDGVLWIDTDAVIIDHETSLDKLSTKSFFCCPDPPFWSAPFNAGVWGVRATTEGRAIMDAWMKLFYAAADTWSKDADGKWSTTGPWAGDTYEQGAFGQHIMSGQYGSHIDTLPYERFQGVDQAADRAFALHFSSHQKPLISKFVEEWLSSK